MCEFCLKHGEGQKWYLQAKHYSDDLLSDVRRRRLIEDFFTNADAVPRDVQRVSDLDKAPRFIKNMISRLVTRRMKKVHFGQVVPIEEIERILGFANSVVRIACICRHVTLGREKRYCYGISLGPNGGKIAELLGGLDKSFLNGPDAGGLEILSTADAMVALHNHETEGLCHTIWTFNTPFVGGVCNCDRSDCLAMRFTVTHSVQVMFRAEYVAAVNPEVCVGCRECMRVCQFGALTYSASTKKAAIDQRWCYGCGVCRSACKRSAIRLDERAKVPVAANLW